MLSVIIPTVARLDLLQRAIQSALDQDHGDFEIIVVDDADGDGQELALDLGHPRVRGIRSFRRGQVAARNLGITAASGRWIAFLDDDDWWAEPTHLSTLAHALQSGDALAFGSGRMVPASNDEPGAEQGLPFVAQATPQSLKHDNTLLVSSIAYPRGLHDRLGPFDDDFPYYWDWDWYLRIASADIPFVGTSSTAAMISYRPDSVSSQSHARARTANLGRLCKKHQLGQLTMKNHWSIAQDQSAALAG
jgi:glycosyltransferase involved in cell wall biosynthesis